MRRVSKIFSLVAAMVVLVTTSFGFAAGGLKVEETSIKDGAKNIQMENLGIKVRFNKSIHFKGNIKANEKFCKLYDSKGKQLPTMILTDDKDPDVLLILLKTAFTKEELKKYGLKMDKRGSVLDKLSKYSFVVEEGFKAADGSILEKEHKISFKTMDPGESMKYSMGMMLLMVVVMIVAVKKQAKDNKEEKELDEKKKKEAKVNPYKKARETGKSVEEIIAKENKRKVKEEAKAAAAAERKAAKEARLEEEDDSEDDGVYRLKAKAPISAAGSKYKSGIAERMRKAEEAREKRSRGKVSRKRGKKNRK